MNYELSKTMRIINNTIFQLFKLNIFMYTETARNLLLVSSLYIYIYILLRISYFYYIDVHHIHSRK